VEIVRNAVIWSQSRALATSPPHSPTGQRFDRGCGFLIRSFRINNHVLPHSAFRGQTADEIYFGTGDAVPADLRSRAGRRAPSTRGGQPIRVLRDVPVTQRGRLTSGRPPFQ
jgi:hypothetical protein